MNTNNSFNLIKIVKIVSPLIAFGVSFILLLLCMNVVTGDIATLIYGGVMRPEYYSPRMGQMEDLEQLQTQYDQAKSELGVPDFPLNLLYVIFHYLMLDFGTNLETDQPISEEYLAMSGISIRLILSSLFIVFIVLSIMMVGFDKLKQRTSNDSKITVFVRILGIISPSFLLLWVFFYLGFVIKGGLSTFVSPWWIDDMSILANLLLPVSLITAITLIPGLISFASGASNKTVFKISVVTIISSSSRVELFFSWRGIGRQWYRALIIRNYPVLLAGIIWIAIIIIIFLIAIELISFNFLVEKPKNQKSIKEILKESSHFNHIYRKLAFEIIILGILILFLVLLSFAYLFAPFHPTEDDYSRGFPSYAPPDGDHIFGTDWAGQDVFSRILFACSILIRLCIPFGILAAIGYLVFSGITQKFRISICQIFSFFVVTAFLSFWGIIPLLMIFIGSYGLQTAHIYFLFTLGFSTGFIFGSWKAQNDIVDLVRNLRQAFSISMILQLILIEFLTLQGLGALPNEPSFCNDIQMVSPIAFIDYPWLLAPLIVLILILIILTGFTLFEIPIDLLKKLNGIFRNQISPKISE